MKRFQLMAAVALLAQQILVAGAVAANPVGQSGGMVEGFVVPSSVHANEPFTFAAQGSVEGEVVEIKTVEGEVVATKKTDKLGRVFLQTGLLAGNYLLSSRGKASSTIQVQVPNSPPDSSRALSFQMPKFVDQATGLQLTGTGFSGNAAELRVVSGKASVPVLASTPREMKTGPLTNLKPGAHRPDVVNQATGERVTGNELVVYRVQTVLARKKLVQGEATYLEFTVLPKELQAEISARIISGPVHFADGGNTAHLSVKNGSGKVPLVADPAGSGKFSLSWEMSNIMVTFVPPERIESNPPQQESTLPCPATRHTMKEIGVWKEAGKRGDLFLATRERQCYVQECRLKKGHGGEHEFGASKACPDKDRDTEERSFSTDADRAKFIKESKSGG